VSHLKGGLAQSLADRHLVVSLEASRVDPATAGEDFVILGQPGDRSIAAANRRGHVRKPIYATVAERRPMPPDDTSWNDLTGLVDAQDPPVVLVGHDPPDTLPGSVLQLDLSAVPETLQHIHYEHVLARDLQALLDDVGEELSGAADEGQAL